VSSVLVLGGTFDPVHNGHLAIARQARAATGSDAVWFLPSAIAPLRDAPVATPEQRFELLVAATAGDNVFRVLDTALQRGGVSYTADLMESLRATHAGDDLAVLVGADAARTIRAWHRAVDLLRAERFVIVNRTGPPPIDPAELAGLGFPSERTTLVTVDSPDISASDIRMRCARGAPLDGLVPDAVASLIAAKGMYRQNRDDA
jgi:nicotinate-nucleotide adenylyltransferase